MYIQYYYMECIPNPNLLLLKFYDFPTYILVSIKTNNYNINSYQSSVL